MNKKKFLIFLTNSDGLCYHLKNGVLAKSSELIDIDPTFDGWKDMMLQFVRNTTYYAVFRSFTIPLRFVKQGAQILRELFYKKGIEEVVNLVILRLNPATGRHEPFYKGEIDFSKVQDSLYYFQVNLAEGGFMKFLKAYESTAFQIPLTGDGVVNVEMNGLALNKSLLYAVIDGQENTGYHTLGCAFASEEGTGFNVVTGSSPLEDQSKFDITTNDDRWIVKVINDSVTFTITGQIDITVRTIPQQSRILLRRNDDTVLCDLIPSQTLNPGDYSFTINQTFTLSKDQKAFILCEKTEGHGHASWAVVYKKNSLKIGYTTKYQTTFVKAINAGELGNRLVQQIAGTDYTLDSPLLKNCGIYLTCGNALRGFADSKITTTFKDFFSNFNRNLNIGLSVNDKIVSIKRKKDYYTSDLLYHLGEVKNVSIQLSDEVFNDLKVGYPDETFDDVNGKDAFLQTYEFKVPITRIAKTLEITGNYKADPYSIEFTRINLDGKTTTDSSTDNDVFMLDIVTSTSIDSISGEFTSDSKILIYTITDVSQLYIGSTFRVSGSQSNNTAFTIKNIVTIISGYQVTVEEATTAEVFTAITFTYTKGSLRRINYDSITGVLNPTAQFNIELSVKRIIETWGDYLHGALWKLDDKQLTFQTTTKNAELKTVLAGVTVEEKANVNIGKLAPAYFYPLTVKFETIVPQTLNAIMQANSTGVFSFEYNGEIYKGYCIEAKQKPSDNEAQEWTLQLSADNDLNKLIHG